MTLPTQSSATNPTPADPYETWKAKPTPANLKAVVKANKPTIDAALRSYAGEAPGNNIRRRAELLAAKAIRRYDPSKGAQLNTYLHNQLQPLRRVAATFANPFPKPERLRRDSAQVFTAKQELSDQLGREPSLEELSDYGKFDLNKLRKIMRRNRATVPESALDSAESDDDDYMPGVKRSEPAAVWADYVYHDLSDIDRVIFQYRTGYNGVPILPNKEIAKRLNLKAPAVSRRAARIQARLDELEATGGA